MIMRRLLYMMTLAAVLLAGCDKDTEPPHIPGDKPVEDVPGEVIPPSVPDVVEAAAMTFCYYDIPAEVDVASRRIDFNLEVWATDSPDLRNIPLAFELEEGYSLKGYGGSTASLTLKTDKSVSVAFVKDTTEVAFDIYVNRVIRKADTTDFHLQAGVNLAYWFQEGVPWTTEGLVQEVSAYGFDHVRIPFDSDTIFDTEGNIIRDHIDVLHRTIEECLDLGLNVILDMHWLTMEHSFYKEAAAKELSGNWKKLIPEFRDYPNDRVAYEILNEPFGPGWELMQRRIVHLIRHFEPERVLLLSPSGYNAAACADFYVHPGDPNVIMTFHYYEPMLASHRKAWGYTGPSHYPGYLFSDEEWETMTDAEREIAQWHRGIEYGYDYALNKMTAVMTSAARNGIRAHCGEFGMSKTNIREERVLWFRDIVDVFSQTGIAYTVWEAWGGDFGPGTISGSPDEEVIDILVSKP